MMKPLPTAWALGIAWLLAAAPTATAASAQRLDVPLRGHRISLTLYRPARAPRGTIIMASGDVGWVGLAVARAQDLAADGYLVVGLNSREYLSTFTGKGTHLEPADIQADVGSLAAFLRGRGDLPPPVLLSGVSEGAGIAVVAAASPANHAWLSGVITMGLPRVSELAWRWSDVTSWLTKRDAAEPSVDVLTFLPAVAPVPLVMLQARRDEYVPAADYEAMARAALEPKRQVVIDASNHRFTDRLPELARAYADALDWIAGQRR